MSRVKTVGCASLCGLISFLLVVLSVPLRAPAGDIGLVDGLWVMKKVDERYEGDDIQEDLLLTLDKTGDRAGNPQQLDVRWLKMNFGREKKLIVHFVAPEYARGVTLNMIIKPYLDDDRWLYYPEANSIRRIQARDEHASFMGTDFSYYDLSEREPDEEDHKLLRVEEFEGCLCYVVETTPRGPGSTGYSRKITWVDKDRFVKLRIQHFNMAGRLQKQYDPDAWRQISGIWTPTHLVMEDFISGHKTVIDRSNVRYNQGVKDAFFLPQNVDCVVYKEGAFSLIPFDQRPTRVWANQKGKPGAAGRGAATEGKSPASRPSLP